MIQTNNRNSSTNNHKLRCGSVNQRVRKCVSSGRGQVWDSYTGLAGSRLPRPGWAMKSTAGHAPLHALGCLAITTLERWMAMTPVLFVRVCWHKCGQCAMTRKHATCIMRLSSVRNARVLSKSKELRDNNLYTTTNKCLQCLLKIMYTVF